ncbi:MAG: YHS domain-containing protein [Sulfuricaulis sp.]|uniref:YHS domain-containing protein n=1 Tax=Sulfuricaulis sp. TaxID=2003553 RepID=UPI0034A1C53C
MATDPVCNMAVEPDKAVDKAEYQGTNYYFCSHDCHKAFTAEPEKYAPKNDTRNPPAIGAARVGHRSH